MAINATTVTNKVIKIKSPNGTFYPVDSVSFAAGSGQATFSFGRVFSYSDNGEWGVYTGEPVLDSAGNASIASKLGSFQVNIPAPPVGDQTPPTLTFVSVTPATITTAGTQNVSIVISIADA